MNLVEAFRALDALNEDTFSVSDDGIAKLADFMQTDDVEDEIKVIDPEAETEEDLQDSYVGKVILDCGVCHSKIYKNKEEIELNDDQTLANVGEECPFCYTSDGFKIIGEVCAFNDGNEDDEAEDVETDSEESDDVIEEAYEDTDGIMGGNKGQKYSDVDLKTYWEKEKDNDPVLKNYNGDFDAWHKDTTAQMKKVNEGFFGKKNNTTKSDSSTSLYSVILVTSNKGRNAGKWTYTGSAPSDDGHKLQGVVADQNRKQDNFKYKVVSYDEAIKTVGRKFDSLKDMKWQRFFESVDLEEFMDANITLDAKGFGGEGNNVSVLGGKLPLGEAEDVEEGLFDRKKKQATKQAPKKVSKWAVLDGWSKDLIIGTYSTQAEAEESAAGRGHDGRYKVRKVQVNENIHESVNNVNVETDEDVINVATDDNGKVTVTTEPKASESTTEDEVIVPVTPETETEIMDSAEEVDTDIEEFDEESFDALGESYLKEVYDNVESYKTVNVSSNDTSIVVEGVIKFNSGAEKKTSFILEARDCTKAGKYRFTGSNKQLTEGRRAYTVSGKVVEGKFISECFNYNYKSMVEGVSKRIYGSIKG